MEKRLNIKKWLLGTALLLISMLAGTSCVMDNDDLPDCPPPTPPSKDAPVVTAGLYCNEKLIAWEEGNAIGVYLIDNEKEALLQDSLGAPYILNDVEKGIFLPQWGISEQVISRPPLGAVYDALGIFPYGNALKDTKTVSLSVTDQSDPEKLDLFIPHRVHSITAETDTIRLDFYRRMSRLLFNLTMTEVGADNTETEANAKLAGASIQVNGLPVNGTFALESDKVETDGIQPFQAYMAENGQQGQAIVFPGTSTKDVRFQVSLPQYPDTLYSFVFSEEMILESCRTHTLALNMKYVHKPAIKQYNIKYRYEGAANKDNVTVTRGNNLTAWGEGDIIVVDENSDFTFQYQSSLKVSVRTEDGEVLPMTPGKPYTFHEIQKDITVIIYVEEDPGPGPGPDPEITHKVTYRYEGEANANNVTVFKDGMSSKWAQTETITVKDKEDFTFGFRSDMIVSVKTKDGETLSMSSGNPYTFTKVEKDIEIIIHADTPEYAVKYVFEGEHTERNVSVEKAISQSSFGSWGKTETVYVREGSDFTFKTNSDFTVTVKVKGQELPKNADGSYTLKNIYEDITVVISTNIHKVTYQYIGKANKDNVSVYKDKNLSQQWVEKTEVVLVDHGADFTFGTDSRHEVTVAGNGETLSGTPVSGSATENTFQLQNVIKDVVVTIGAVTEEDLLEHEVQYVFIGDATANNTNVTFSGIGWNTDDIKTVDDGADFTFNAEGIYTLTVTACLTNDQTVDVPVTPSGNTYTLSNIKKNVTVYISAKTHTVSYTYSGTHVDANTIPILEGDATTSPTWKPGTEGIITVDHNGNFIFTNNSKFNITVTGYGEEFTVKAGQSYSISGIKEDINLVITANIYQIIYEFDNVAADKVETWTEVKHNNNSWNEKTAIYIEKGKDFAFYFDLAKGINGRIIHVKEETDDDISFSSSSYTLSNIQADKHIHLKAVKTYTVYYKFANETNVPKDFKIWKKAPDSTAKEEWTQKGEAGKVTLDAGSDFQFGINKNFEVTINDSNISLTNGNYTISSIQEDKVIVLDAGNKPYVTIIDKTGKIEVTYEEHSDYVTSGDDFTIRPQLPENLKDKYIIKVESNLTNDTSKVTVTDNRDGSYTITGVTKDTDLTISAIRQPADVIIEAIIKDWTELKNIDGGIIYPN